jgi:hypothetical protein
MGEEVGSVGSASHVPIGVAGGQATKTKGARSRERLPSQTAGTTNILSGVRTVKEFNVFENELEQLENDNLSSSGYWGAGCALVSFGLTRFQDFYFSQDSKSDIDWWMALICLLVGIVCCYFGFSKARSSKSIIKKIKESTDFKKPVK